MKQLVVGAAIFAAFVIGVRLERPAILSTPPNERPLTAGEQNPPLRHLREGAALSVGTPVWFHLERSSFGTVVALEDDSVLIRWNSGQTNWVAVKHLGNAWVPAKP